MRILSLPVALLAAACLYLLFPRAAEVLAAITQALYTHFLTFFTRKNGKTDDELAFPLFLLLFGGVCQIIGGLHFIAAGVLMSPLLRAFSLIPEAVSIKDQLDRGVYARSFGEYDARVRSACAAFAPAFVTDMCAPLLLLALGTPLHMGCLLGGAYFAARMLCDRHPAARRTVALVHRPAWQVMRLLLLLCCGLVGRSPSHVHGEHARDFLLSVLGIAGHADDTHTPVSGDITQAVFLCCLCIALLALLMGIALFAIC